MGKKKIVVLAGGWSGEREVSLGSGKTVYDALDKERYDVELYDPKDHLGTLLEHKDNIDLAFILLHGKMGEDGRIQGFLDLLGIPYVGSGVLSSSMALNKKITKYLYQGVGLKVPRFHIRRRGEKIQGRAFLESFGGKVVVKPIAEGSSLGISICDSEESLLAGIKEALLYDDEVMLEEYIGGREITCCVTGNRDLETLPLIEIVPTAAYDFFDYEAKYTSGATNEICPADLDETIAERLRDCAKVAHHALQCKAWSRTDMIVSGEDIYMLETNTIPGMTENSLFPRAASAAGLAMSALLDRLIELSLPSANPG
ncbi:MAG: D-alanine--D-alanine ligase [Deltaproteobacteria bacterium]|nr:MAG: D-alanine--D-alanine ligase [Deltaproteobacteria bacterium]